MRCHYEVLGVDREATAAEIKSAYRRLALQWHPDKNIDDEQRAKEQFQLIQTAYEVLSDLQERAWYDKHREQLLRGAGTEFTDDSLDVFPFMSPSCYKGFADDDKGFFSVYREVFNKLVKEESEFLENPEDITLLPDFGDSSSPYESVDKFYNFWMSFSTSKSYVWLNKHDIRQAHRKLVKVIEREHAKVQATARRERNVAVRTLVSYVRRRDPRVKSHLAELRARAEQNREKIEAARVERLAVKRESLLAEAEAERVRRAEEDVEYARKLLEVERHLRQEFGVSSDDLSTDDEFEEDEVDTPQVNDNDNVSRVNAAPDEAGVDELSRNQRLYCSACRKPFNTVPSFQNHEKSKKHRENVARLSLDNDVPVSTDDTSLPAEAAVETAKKKKKKKKNKVKKRESSADGSDLDQSNDDRSFAELNQLQGGRKAKRLERKIRLLAEKQDNSNPESDSESTPTNGDNAPTPDSPKRSNSLVTEETKPSDLQTKPTKVKSKPQIKKLLTNEDANIDRLCAACLARFPSKNKLFEHLKKTGHQVPLGAAALTVDSKTKRRGKR